MLLYLVKFMLSLC